MDDFANYPESVAERRSDASRKASDWSPRECLISVLRQIDRGEIDPKGLIVCWCEVDDKAGVSETSFRASMPNPLLSQGLLLRTAQIITAPDEGR